MSMKCSSTLAILNIIAGVAFQFPPESFSDVDAESALQPLVIPLRRESVPIKRQGKTVSFRTSYSGLLSVGSPVAQEFRVVFDTGSGHVVIPSTNCESEACLVHKSFNTTLSESALPINSDGTIVPPEDLRDQVTIGFGTGEITGEFVRDRVCLGAADMNHGNSSAGCVDMNVILAVEMSTTPFKSFLFDGIIGLGLSSLALSNEFSFFEMMSGSGYFPSNEFGVFLTEGDHGEQSEISIGGHNANKTLTPLFWSPVAKVELGYWQVKILAVRIDGVELDVCKDGTCRGVVDTGTSHLGIPGPFDQQFKTLLTRDAGDLLDCRLVEAPLVEYELETTNLTVSAHTYMRRLPLREGVNVEGSGVSNPDNVTEINATAEEQNAKNARDHPDIDENVTDARRICRPKLMAVNLPEPVGPKLFILGEPVLHRYYSVYDWANLRVGFGLANTHLNTADPDSRDVSHKGDLPDDVERLLMQNSVSVGVKTPDGDATILMQVTFQRVSRVSNRVKLAC